MLYMQLRQFCIISPVRTEKWTRVASLFNVHRVRTRAGLVNPVSVTFDRVGYHVNLRYVTSVCWHNKPELSLDHCSRSDPNCCI